MVNDQRNSQIAIQKRALDVATFGYAERTMSLAGFELIIFAPDARASLLHNYDKLNK